MKRQRGALARGLFVAAVVVTGAACVEGQERPDGGNEGSAQWAAERARARLAAFAADAAPRALLAARVAADGRLFANTGTWSVVAFSASRQEKLEVVVDADGTLSETTTAATSVGVQDPLPAAWLDSTQIFERARGVVPAFEEATIVTFNLTDFGGDLAGKATWAINTPGGNALVSADGTIARKQ